MIEQLLTGFSPIVAVSIVAVVALFIINICYKYMMDQEEAKKMKKENKELNKKWKKMQKEDPEKAKKFMNEMMSSNNKLMMMSMKPMIVSMVIILLILPGIANVYGNINLGENQTSVVLYDVNYTIQQKPNEIILSNGNEIRCELDCRKQIGETYWNIKERDNGIEMERIVALLPISLPLFGNDLGWLAWYFICSIPLMIVIKRLLNVNI